MGPRRPLTASGSTRSTTACSEDLASAGRPGCSRSPAGRLSVPGDSGRLGLRRCADRSYQRCFRCPGGRGPGTTRVLRQLCVSPLSPAGTGGERRQRGAPGCQHSAAARPEPRRLEYRPWGSSRRAPRAPPRALARHCGPPARPRKRRAGSNVPSRASACGSRPTWATKPPVGKGRGAPRVACGRGARG